MKRHKGRRSDVMIFRSVQWRRRKRRQRRRQSSSVVSGSPWLENHVVPQVLAANDSLYKLMISPEYSL